MRTLIRTNMAPNPSVVGTTTYNSTTACSAAVSNEWWDTGNSSIKLTATGTTSDSFSPIQGDTGGFRLGLQAGKTYSISATVYTPVAQSGVLSGRARQIALFYKDVDTVYKAFASTSGPVVGSARVSVTGTIPAGATEAFLRLYNGSPTAGEVVYWDSLLIEESPSVGEYFDGSTLESMYLFNKWTGTPNASTSEQYQVIHSAGYDPSKALSDARNSTIETILGPSPVRTINGTFNDVRNAGLEKVLRDNGIIQ